MFRCKNMEGCEMYNLMSSSVRIIELQPLITRYCLSEQNYRSCARFRFISDGEVPPVGLLPDGKTLKY